MRGRMKEIFVVTELLYLDYVGDATNLHMIKMLGTTHRLTCVQLGKCD